MSAGARANSALSMRPATRLFLAASAFSSLGNGLTFPVCALYLVRVRSMPLAAVSVFYSRWLSLARSYRWRAAGHRPSGGSVVMAF